MRVLRPHHQLSIDRLARHFKSDPDNLALIIGGSIAHGYEREDSDVDFMLVVTDEAQARHQAAGRAVMYATEFTEYPGGYSDGKILDLGFLRDVAQKGSDPARYAFKDAWTAFSRDPEIDRLVAAIPTYPEADHERRIASFYAQVAAMRWFAGEAGKRSDPYLMVHVASTLSLFACRLILAHNRMLYPFHKWLLRVVDEAPDKPEAFVERIRAFTASPSPEEAQALATDVLAWRDWGVAENLWTRCFMEDVEWTWRVGRPGIADW